MAWDEATTKLVYSGQGFENEFEKRDFIETGR